MHPSGCNGKKKSRMWKILPKTVGLTNKLQGNKSNGRTTDETYETYQLQRINF